MKRAEKLEKFEIWLKRSYLTALVSIWNPAFKSLQIPSKRTECANTLIEFSAANAAVMQVTPNQTTSTKMCVIRFLFKQIICTALNRKMPASSFTLVSQHELINKEWYYISTKITIK